MTKMRKAGLVTTILVALAVLVGAVRDPDIYFLIKKNFTIFSDVYREVSTNYVDEVNPEKLMRTGINSMLESLDPYTVLIDESQQETMNIITRGSYGGVGMEVGFKGDRIVVVSPMEGYSAYRKGIRSGDEIVSIDGISVENMSPGDVQEMTLGEPGTTVSITINRYGLDQHLTFDLKRERIEVKNIEYYGLIGRQQDVGYILLSRFAQNAGEEVRSALNELRNRADLRGLILDVRNNPGGLLEEAVKIVDKFVKPGLMVVETRGRNTGHNNIYKTEETVMAGELPLVVLQNNGSASASEIVSGSLQDLDRAVIIGEQSFGKGLVQIVKPLSYNTALKMTTSRYYIPSGRSIQSIDYTHRADSNGVNRPDSLRKAFQTRNGRTVYDGDGINPDITIENAPPSRLETALLQQSYFFFFANRFASRNDTFTSDQVTPELYDEFRMYLREQDFSYRTPSEQYLDRIEHQFDPDRMNSVSEHLEAVKTAIEQEKEEEFTEQETALKRKLFLELVSRYNGRAGQIEASLSRDTTVSAALEVLNNPEQYREILNIGG